MPTKNDILSLQQVPQYLLWINYSTHFIFLYQGAPTVPPTHLQDMPEGSRQGVEEMLLLGHLQEGRQGQGGR